MAEQCAAQISIMARERVDAKAEYKTADAKRRGKCAGSEGGGGNNN